MTSRRAVLRTDGDGTVGVGHVTRCIRLATALRSRGYGPALALRHASEGVLAMAAGAGLETILVPPGTAWDAESGVIGPADVVLFDVTHAAGPHSQDDVRGLFGDVGGAFTVCIDGVSDEALTPRLTTPVDLAVIPYVGAHRLDRGAVRWLLGPAYMVIDPALSAAPREQPAQAQRLLVTAGGGDPAGITELALEGLRDERVRDVVVRMVIGPTVAPERADRLDALGASSGWDVIRAPRSLVEHLAWADIAVVATGLTKYEAAATGTPTIGISPDAFHVEANRAFAMTGAMLDLGLADGLDPGALADAVVALCHDHHTRASMAKAGRALVDGRGTDRVIREIEESDARRRAAAG